jgi:hypothetical protein
MYWFNLPPKLSFWFNLLHNAFILLYLHTQFEFYFETLQGDGGHHNYIRKYFINFSSLVLYNFVSQ